MSKSVSEQNILLQSIPPHYQKQFAKWLQTYLHDFPDQFPRNRPKYRIENEFIQKLLEDLKK